MFSVDPRVREANPATSPLNAVLLGTAGIAVALYFIVRSWLTAGLVIAGALSAWQVLAHRHHFSSLVHDRRLQWLLLAFGAPLLATVLVNAWQGHVIWRSLDAPIRLLLAAMLMLELSRRRLSFVRVAHYAFPAALIVCAAWIYLAPQSSSYFWGGRYATPFMDPLMLSQHAMIAGFICLFLATPPAAGGSRLLSGVHLTCAVLAVLIALGTQSRTGWLMAPLLAVLWLARATGKVTPVRIALAVGGVLIACVFAYVGSEVVRTRVNEAHADVSGYLAGQLDSSVGHRISFIRIALLLFAERPLLGWGFAALPDLAKFPPVASFYTPLLDQYFVMAGVHNEFLQAMMRMGLAGLVSKLLLYGVPLVVFARATRSRDDEVRTSGYLGLVVVVGFVTAGMSSEVTNLIYAASFYGLLVAVFAAGILRERSP